LQQLFPGFSIPAATGAGASPLLALPDEDLGRAFADWSARSARYAEIQSRYYQKVMALWSATLARSRGDEGAPVAAPSPGDRRFAAREWREVPFYDYVKQSYLLLGEFIREAVEAAELEPRAKDRLRFFMRQSIDALAPVNFAATNPEVIRTALESSGESLARGVRNLIADVEKGRISNTDEEAFEVGRNLAVTDGSVIYENDFIQLIQYRPRTATVRARPLLIVPPCINKYYVLDLSQNNSFIKHAVECGHTVFVISWRNPVAELQQASWDDYLAEGVIRAMDIVRDVTGSDKLNALGFCVGGTLVASALAVLAARGEDRVASLTLLATFLDYADTGEIGLLVDEPSVQIRERTLGGGGLLSGQELALVFSTLRANDLVWSYTVNNYLLGKKPDAFDILYWNADSTNLPGPMYCYYLRSMYLENRLREPGALTMCGEKIDLARLRIPSYILATREDHIVPWKSAYRSTQVLKGENRFVLGASGHIAGVLNPPAANKRSYWINTSLPSNADDWLTLAVEKRGSWWSDWIEWLGRFGGGEVPARERLGNDTYAPIEAAPGRYVKVRIDRVPPETQRHGGQP